MGRVFVLSSIPQSLNHAIPQDEGEANVMYTLSDAAAEG